MIRTAAFYLLPLATFFWYAAGAFIGLFSMPAFLVLALLHLAQLYMAARLKNGRAAGLTLLSCLPLTGSLFIGKLHDRILSFAAQDDLLNHLTFVMHGASGVLGLLPLLLIGGAFLAFNRKYEVRWDELFARLQVGAAKQAGERAVDHPPVRLCRSIATRQDVSISGEDRYLHTLIVGPTGGGKTALIFEPMVNQDIEHVAGGGAACVIVVEPDGEFAVKTAGYCEELGVPFLHLDATHPAGLCWNPLEGDPVTVAETVTTVLQSAFGRQEAFFSIVQATAARNTTLLLKLLDGDEVTLLDLAAVLRETGVLKDKINRLKGKVKKEFSGETVYIAQNVIKSLEAELATPQKEERYTGVCMGLRQQIDNLIGNPRIRQLLCGKSSVRLEDFLESSGALLVNTGNNASGDMFGMFLLLAMQDATLRRPGTAETRTPVFTYIDEFARYATDGYKAAFTQGRKYRNAQILALQNFSQLSLDANPNYKTVVKGNCRNKIILSGLEYEDACEAEKMMGTIERMDEMTSYEKGLLWRENERHSERTLQESRFSANDLMLMPWNQIVCKVVKNKQALAPEAGVVAYAVRKRRDEIRKKRARK